LLGATLAAAAVNRSWARSRRLNQILGGLSLLTLAVVIHAYGPQTRYPGLYTIAPCAATAVLLALGEAEQAPAASRLLALPPLVLTGLISYSLYLWHLPVLILVAYYNIVPLSPLELAAVLAVIYALAFLSWQFVEKPVRFRSVLASNRVFVGSAVTAGAAVLAIGLVLWQSGGFPDRYPRSVRDPDRSWVSSSASVLACVNRHVERIASAELCSYGPPDAPRVLVWGDSHAMVTLPAYERLANEWHVRIYYAIKPACRPLLGVTNRTDSKTRQIGCANFNAAVVEAIHRINPRLVILNAHWIDKDADLIPNVGLAAAPGASHFQRGIEQMLTEIHAPGREVCVVLDVPHFEYNIPQAVAIARKRGISEQFLQLSRAAGLAQYQEPEADFRALQMRGLLTTVDLKDRLCRVGGNCAYEADGNLLYVDKDHLSVKGALYVTGVLAGCLQGVLPDRR
jgi:hypothetical protein